MGWEKVACWSTKATIYLKRVEIEEKLLWRAYRNSPRLGFATPIQIPKTSILLSKEWVKLRTSNLASTFTGSIQTKVHQKLEKRERGRIQGLSKVLKYRYYLRNG